MFSTFVAYTILNRYGLSWWGVLPLTLVLAAIQGVIVQQVVIRPLLGAPVLNAVIATLGLNIALHSLAAMIWGAQTHVMQSPLADVPNFKFFGVNVAPDSALSIVVSVAMILIFTLVLRHTRAGIALRAASQNQAVAKLMGIPINRAFAMAWAMGARHMLLLAFTSALCDISSLHISTSPRRAQCIRGVLSLPLAAASACKHGGVKTHCKKQPPG